MKVETCSRLTEAMSAACRYIKSQQKPCGAIPWYEAEKLDPWDHTEAAMGLCIGGEFDAAKRAFTWLWNSQEAEGYWFARYFGDEPDHLDHSKIETNFVAYPACGLWHYVRCSGDWEFARDSFPFIRRAIDFVLQYQSRDGDIQWAMSSREKLPKDALITACASMARSLECAIALADALEVHIPDWQNRYQRLVDALRNKPWRFDRTWEPKTRFSMDWFYPILAGVLTRAEAQERIAARWAQFVEKNMGCRCVSDEPWMTVAETCELALALMASGQHPAASTLLYQLLRWQDHDGGFWTGYNFRDDAIWPQEKTTWTAGAFLLATDALTHTSEASDLFTSASAIALPSGALT